MLMDDSEPLADAVNRESANRFLAAADAKGACVETSARGFKLYKRFAPIEETAFFGRKMWKYVEKSENLDWNW